MTPLADTTTTPKPKVTFAFSKKTLEWDDKYANILEFAEANGLAPDFSCRTGICRTCECELVAGKLTYTIEPLDSPEDGMAFICCSKPDGDVTFNI
jgi:uncharacterized protein